MITRSSVLKWVTTCSDCEITCSNVVIWVIAFSNCEIVRGNVLIYLLLAMTAIQMMIRGNNSGKEHYEDCSHEK